MHNDEDEGDYSGCGWFIVVGVISTWIVGSAIYHLLMKFGG